MSGRIVSRQEAREVLEAVDGLLSDASVAAYGNDGRLADTLITEARGKLLAVADWLRR